jgi:hypothetical protein
MGANDEAVLVEIVRHEMIQFQRIRVQVPHLEVLHPEKTDHEILLAGTMQ